MTMPTSNFFWARSPWQGLGVLFCLVLLLAPTISWGALQEGQGSDDPIVRYQKNRQAFLAEQQQANQAFTSQAAALQKEVETLQRNIDTKQKELTRLQSVITDRHRVTSAMAQAQSAAAFPLFPLLSTLSMAAAFFGKNLLSVLPLLFLAITVVNVFLYLVYKQREFFRQHRIPLVVAVVVLIGCMASPLFAADANKREQVIAKLERTEKMLSKSEYERFIAILEEKPSQQIKLPTLQSGDPLLTVFPEVVVDSPEYWMTLAALHTHEKQNGKALEAVKKIIKESRLQHTKAHQQIILGGMKYLLQEQQTQEVSGAVESLGTAALDVSTLLEVSDLLKQNGMQASAEKALGYAIARAGTVADLLHLARYFHEHQAIDKSSEALEKALSRARNIDEILQVGQLALTVGKDPLLGKVVSAADTVTNDSQAKMKVVDLFLQHNRKEEAVNLVSLIIRSATSRSKENVEKLLFVIDAGLKRNLLPQATTATETLIVMLGLHQAKNYPIQSGATLRSAQGLPDQSAIMLPQFLGLIREEQGLNDLAEEAYIFSVIESLTTILESYGYTFPTSLNDFHLLGRNWASGNRGDLIGPLDGVYTMIETQFVKQLIQKNDERIDHLRGEIETLKKTSTELQTGIAANQRQATQAMARLVAQSLSTVATVLFVLAALLGCGVLAYRYCLGLSMGKTFGFFMKLGENLGWLQVLSVLGAVTGVASILFAQTMLMFQMIQENTRRAAGSTPPLAAPPSNRLVDPL